MPMFISALYTVAKIWKQPKCSLIYCWIKKMWYIYYIFYIIYYIYSYIIYKTLISHKKDKILPFLTTRMNLEDYHAKRHKSHGKEWLSYDFTHMWNIKQKATNKLTKQTHKFTDTGNRRWLPEGKRVGGQMYGDGGRLEFVR